jgi:hypothetical protein
MIDSSQKLRINLFGEWWSLMKVKLNPVEQEYFTQIANRLQQPLHQALLDPFFYHYLRLTTIPSLDKLPCEKFGGLLGTTNHQIEVWIDGKKRKKILIQEFNSSQYLFPIYNTQTNFLNINNNPGIYLEQKEIGFIGAFECQVGNFSFDNLLFELIEYNGQILLHGIQYLQAQFAFKKRDTVITFQNSFEVLT